MTSATSAAGVADLRRALMETVIARQAALQRISADVDAVAARFVPYAGDADALARVATALDPGPATLDPGAAAPSRLSRRGTPGRPERAAGSAAGGAADLPARPTRSPRPTGSARTACLAR